MSLGHRGSLLGLLLARVSALAAPAPTAVTYSTPYAESPAAPGLADTDPCNYGWNNNNSNPPNCRGTITEGCAQYENGPRCWSNDGQPDGAYGWINLCKMTNTSAECPPIPVDGIGTLLGPDTPLFPASMAEALTPPAGSSLCFLACNKSEVERTGVDPCNAGTIPAGKPLPSWILPPLQPFGSPELLPGPLQMNCYYGGKGWMKDPTMGMCGYNMTFRNSKGDYCTSVSEPNCGLVIDPRRVPCCGGTPQCEGDDNAGGNIKGALTATPPPLCCSCKEQLHE